MGLVNAAPGYLYPYSMQVHPTVLIYARLQHLSAALILCIRVCTAQELSAGFGLGLSDTDKINMGSQDSFWEFMAKRNLLPDNKRIFQMYMNKEGEYFSGAVCLFE